MGRWWYWWRGANPKRASMSWVTVTKRDLPLLTFNMYEDGDENDPRAGCNPDSYLQVAPGYQYPTGTKKFKYYALTQGPQVGIYVDWCVRFALAASFVH